MSDDGRRPFLEVLLIERRLCLDVRGATIEDHDRYIDKATVQLDDTHGTFRDTIAEGQTLQISMGWENEHAVLFEGIVASSPGRMSRERHGVSIVAYDPSYSMMTRAARSHDFTGSLSSIIRRIAETDNGLTIGQIEVADDVSFTEEAPLRQTVMRDYHFMQELAYRHGARAYVEYNEGSNKFYFASEERLLSQDPMGTLSYCRGIGKLREFTYERTAGGAAAVRGGSAVDPESGEVTTVTPPDPATGPAADSSSARHSRLARYDDTVAARYDGAAERAASADPPDAQRPTEIIAGAPSDPQALHRETRQDRTRVIGLQCKGKTVGSIWLRAKGRVELFGISPWIDSNSWYVHKVTHRVTTSGDDMAYETEFEASR
jgi:phage protein D